ncbi:MAG: hypothetical protein WAV05_07085 [Anaerolineales bacterium]
MNEWSIEMSDQIKYDEARAELKKYNQAHELAIWQPNKKLTQLSNRCVYLYGEAGYYAKYDLKLKIIIEYQAPDAPRLRDFVHRDGDYGYPKKKIVTFNQENNQPAKVKI